MNLVKRYAVPSPKENVCGKRQVTKLVYSGASIQHHYIIPRVAWANSDNDGMCNAESFPRPHWKKRGGKWQALRPPLAVQLKYV